MLRRQTPGAWPYWRLKLRLKDCWESKPNAMATLRIGSSLRVKRSSDFCSFPGADVFANGMTGMLFEYPLKMPF